MIQCSTLGKMWVTYRIPHVAFLGLLVFLSLFSDRGFGTAETIVDTESHVVLEVGTRGTLPCRIQTKAYSVEWKRQLSSETELLVLLDTYVYVGALDGPGYKAGLFNMTDDYSLVIKDVKVQDEGLYICSVSDFKSGKLFRNSTRVSVQAFPEEPFPIIQECIGKYVNPGVCTVTVHSTSTLTCLVKGYYPDIDLFFLHGSEKMISTKYEEWNNADGTKNKNIKIEVSVSDEPYQCVASGLTGIGRNRSASVNVQALPQARSQGPHAAAIVIPVLITAGMCLSIAFIYVKCYLRKGRGRYSKRGFQPVPENSPMKEHILVPNTPKGPVSKPELWKLVTIAKDSNDFEALRKALRRLGRLSETAASNLQNDFDFYESLCTWKGNTTSNPNQRDSLYSVCCEAGMADIIRKLTDFVLDISYEVSRADIEHILWDIGDTRKIAELLKTLRLDYEVVVTEACESGIKEVINIARKKLLDWRQGMFDMNPLVTLSLKLEDLPCETNFFQLQVSRKEVIDEEMMQGMCCQVFGQHYMYLMKAIRDITGEDRLYQLPQFVEENNESLFNAVKMLHDWVQDEECSNYEKRNKLQEAVKAALQKNHADAKWPPDDDLRAIASFLSPASKELLCSRLHIKSPSQGASKEEWFQALTEWRDSRDSARDLMEKHTELFNALKEVTRGGLIPRVKGNFVYKAEVVDLAFHLFSQDLLPFTEALGISAAKLVAYRPKFQPSHMTQGTIGLVCKLFKSVERSHFLDIMKKIPYPNVFACAMLALEISYIEVCVIAASPDHVQALNRMQASFTTSTSLPDEDDSFITTVEKKFILPGAKSTHLDHTYDEGIQRKLQNEIFNATTTMLTSANQVEDHNQVSAESLAFIKHFKVWRARPRLSPFDFRLALANRLGIEYYHQLSDFLRDLTNDPEEGIMPFTFIHNILQTMDPNQREILGNLMSEASFKPVAKSEYVACIPFNDYRDNWLEMTEDVINFVYHWTNGWILEMILTKGEKGKEGKIAKKHRECNDKLVDHGFLDLAREIMISEQLPIDASSFTAVYEEK